MWLKYGNSITRGEREEVFSVKRTVLAVKPYYTQEDKKKEKLFEKMRVFTRKGCLGGKKGTALRMLKEPQAHPLILQ